MATRLLFFFSLLISSASAFAQTPVIQGRLLDPESKQPVIGATVTLTSLKDSAINYDMISSDAGMFKFSPNAAGNYQLMISAIGYEVLDSTITWQLQTVDLGTIQLAKAAKELQQVVVTGRQATVQMKGDTLEMNADQLKVNPDASSEDLIKKAPGITVENGVVKANGEQVRKVTVDGRDFFGDDATATLRNLPAEVVDKIQVFDRLSDQAQLTGIDDGNTSKSINIVTKPDKRNGQFGRVFAGYGTDNHYLAGGNMSFFKNARRISIVGLTNDVNQQNFTEMDLLGVTSSSNRGGFRGRGGGGFGGGGGNFLVGNSPGVSRTNALGFNYSDNWGKKVELSGSYFFNDSKLMNTENSRRENLPTNANSSSSFIDQTTESANHNYNHRASLRLEYKIDSSTNLLVTPSIGFQRYNSFSDISALSYTAAGTSNATENITRSNRDAINFNNNILLRHSFARRGRSISIGFSNSINNNDGATYLDNYVTNYKTGVPVDDSLLQYTDQLRKGSRYSARFDYTEPLGNKGAILQFSLSPSWSKNKSNQEVYEFEGSTGKYSSFDDSLSNVFESAYNTQRGGLSFRKGDRNQSIGIGIDYQAAQLNSDQFFPYKATVNRSFGNFLPNAFMRFALGKQSNVRIFYRANTNEPSVNQLQDVYTYSNSLYISTGNPNLKQEYGHRLGFRYQWTNTKKAQALFVNMFGSVTNDYVGTATYRAAEDSMLTSDLILYRGAQLSKPQNFDGRWNVNSYLTYSMPLRFMKTNMSINGGWSYNRTPGLINDTLNVANSYSYNGGLILASNISEYIDFTLSYNAGINNTNNSVSSTADNRYVTQTIGARLNLLSKTGWLFNTDINSQTYSGLSEGFNQHFILWNMAVAKKFLKTKRAELRLSVFDLLNQNQSIIRTVTESYIEDVNTRVLKQYFMLTFTYNLKNFGKAPERGNRDFGPPGGGLRRF